jgi:muramoyltetrapeptide carboxypeptidase
VSPLAPPRIKPGDTIGIVAPAGPIKSRDALQRGLDRLASTFTLVVGDTVTAARDAELPSYLSASDAERADELNGMLANPDIRAIVCARGGYGLTRILDSLDPTPLVRDPKPIVGFSDATALLAWAYAAGVRGIHGPVVVQLGNLPILETERLIRLLTDPAPLGRLPWSIETADDGRYVGHLIPANLTLASMLVGTRWPLPLDGAIALFEEVGEKPYEIDRYLTQLEATRALYGVEAVLWGELVRCVDPNPPTGEPDPADAAQRVIVDRLAYFATPCAFGAPIGHGDRNTAIPFGAACELDLDERILTIVDGAVA